jgi:hypothetical protein
MSEQTPWNDILKNTLGGLEQLETHSGENFMPPQQNLWVIGGVGRFPSA